MLNLPNILTLSRLVLTIPFLVCLEFPGLEVWALAIFAVASLTDWLDGYLARKLNQITTLGKLLDPLGDKVLVTGALVALAAKDIIPAWSVTAILFREFLVTGLRAIEASRGMIIPAGWLGKIKTVLQMAAIIVLLYALLPGGQFAQSTGMVLYWTAVAMTIASGVQYLMLSKDLFREPQ
ncbi:MAG: CDP-diacylglycerol--glycerol-3-phosphate 3-phosphatidyltransferase [Candidatus Sericytochromatia bacterium]